MRRLYHRHRVRRRAVHLAAASLVMGAALAYAAGVRPPNVAGSFYPSDPKVLADQVDRLLGAAQEAPSSAAPAVIFVPHAGYEYSGRVAASVYRQLRGRRYSTVILIGPAHHGPAAGTAVWAQGSWRTPLGDVEVDVEAAARIAERVLPMEDPEAAYSQEHSLEVQLPFLQRTLPGTFRIVPVLTNELSTPAREVLTEAVLAELERGDVLLVISTDMKHFRSDSVTRAADGRTLELLESGDLQGLVLHLRSGQGELCGAAAALCGIEVCRRAGMLPRRTAYATSAEVTGDAASVVGYGALMAGPAQTSEGGSKELLSIARQTLETFVRGGGRLQGGADPPELTGNAAVFVTLRGPDGALRGCIGGLEAKKPLGEAVREMTIAAASEDTRFEPVTAQELDGITIEISVLSELKRLSGAAEVDPSVHGILLRRGARSGVFLPKVAAETGWGRAQLLDELCEQKAGLERGCWMDPRTEISVFTTTEMTERRKAG